MPSVVKLDDLIARRSMGDHNTIHQLQNYIAGIAPGGLVVKARWHSIWTRASYMSTTSRSLHNLTVRNNVQAGVSNHPVDLLAVRIPAELVKPLITDTEIAPDVVWVSAGPEQQALILAREDSQGRLSFRYLPIKNLTQDETGHYTLTLQPGNPGFRCKSSRTQT